MEYFIASQMRIDEAFRVWIFEENNCLGFINEVEYYSGLERSAEDILDMMGSRFDAVDARLSEEAEWEPDLDLFGGFSPPGREGDLFGDIEEQLASPALTAEERDEVLDWEVPRDAEERAGGLPPNIGRCWAGVDSMSTVIFGNDQKYGFNF